MRACRTWLCTGALALILAGWLGGAEAGRSLPAEAHGSGPPARAALSRPSAGLTSAERLDFQLGKALFERSWVAAPASTDSADGLGPLYNARACSGCHPRTGRGLPLAKEGQASAALVLHLSVPPRTGLESVELEQHRQRFLPEPSYGTQLQPLALPGQVAEGWVEVRYRETEVRLAEGETAMLRRPSYGIRDLGYGPLDPETLTSPRLAPRLVGLGPLDAVPEAAILAHSDPGDSDGDGISGRPNRVWDPARGRVGLGRYGWKAGEASVEAQIQSAFARDLGIATPLYTEGAGDCTGRQPLCRAAPHGNSRRHAGVEAGPEVMALVTAYVRGLAVPPRRDAAAPAVLEGEGIFHRVGCAACHRPELPVADALPGADAARGEQVIRPYTDLLLHDMGEGLADGRPEGDANGREWRTAPLWGIGPVASVGGQAAWLHDGRARSLLEAILWHDGEARASRDAVVALPTSSRAKLVRFLESI